MQSPPVISWYLNVLSSGTMKLVVQYKCIRASLSTQHKSKLHAVTATGSDL